MTAAAGRAAAPRCLPFNAPGGAMRLYCLPHAGGSAATYRGWTGRLGPVAVCPLQPPGRDTRLRDAPHTRMAPLVAELADAVLADTSLPYAVYGHSLGALVGFELLREIDRRGGPAPAHFAVSGAPAPHLSGSDGTPRVTGMGDPEVIELLRTLGGTPEQLLADPTVLRMILPPFRADFAVKESYGYAPGPPLDVPITALAASADPRASVEAVAAWREHTTRGFTLHRLAGGHFAVLQQPYVTQELLRQALDVRLPSG